MYDNGNSVGWQQCAADDYDAASCSLIDNETIFIMYQKMAIIKSTTATIVL